MCGETPRVALERRLRSYPACTFSIHSFYACSSQDLLVPNFWDDQLTDYKLLKLFKVNVFRTKSETSFQFR